MPIFHTQSREELRAMYVDSWRRRRELLPLEPLQAQIADVIELHPEYQRLIESDKAAVGQDFQPEGGQTNPFLHMGLHLAVRDQIATNRPPGIRAVFNLLAARLGSVHDAEHAMIDKLAEALWNAQRSGLAPDEQAYLEQLQRLAQR
jgi:hypothetical protein